MFFKGCVLACLLAITCAVEVYYAVNPSDSVQKFSCNRENKIFHPCGTLENLADYYYPQNDSYIAIYLLDTRFTIATNTYFSFTSFTMVEVRPLSNRTQAVINCVYDFSIATYDVDMVIIESIQFQRCGKSNPVIIINEGNKTVQLAKLSNTNFIRCHQSAVQILSSIQELQIIDSVFQEVMEYSVYINSHHVANATVKNVDFSSNAIGSLSFHSISTESSLILLNCLFTNNTSEDSQSGSAIKLYKLHNITIFNCSFSKNSPQGAILIENVHHDIFQAPLIQIQNSMFIDNLARYGGALLLKGYFNITVYNSNFTQNRAIYDGGSIEIVGQKVSYIENNFLIVSSLFYNNSAHFGGALRINSGALTDWVTNFKASYTVFSNNNAEDAAGALSLDGFKSNFQNCKFIENTAGTIGGAIAIFKAGDTIINNCTFDKNSVSFGVGGAVGIHFTTDLTVNCSNFNYNTAIYGGAMEVHGITSIIHKSNFTSNQAAENGGGLNIDARSIKITDSHWLNNSALTGLGGALNVTTGKFIMNFSIFLNNVARSGGALSINSFYTFFRNAYFVGNKAEKGNGGAISAESGTFNIDKCIFSKNTALQGIGGGLQVYADELRVTVCNFNNNSAVSGGVFYIPVAINIHFQSSNFSGNSACQKNGGALEFLSDIMYIMDCIFINNSAAGSGGVIIAEVTNLTITFSTFVTNLAITGGVLEIISCSSMSFHNSKYIENVGDRSGALNLTGSKIQLYNCTFINNSVSPTGIGGAINIISSKNLIIYNTHFIANEAEIGGAIKIERSPKVILLNCQFTNNMAEKGGGAISLTKTNESEVYITRSMFFKNFAAKGGALAFDTVVTQISNLLADSCNYTETLQDVIEDTGSKFHYDCFTAGEYCPFILTCGSLNTSNISIIMNSSFLNNSIHSKEGEGGALAIQGSKSTNDISENFDNKNNKYVGAVISDCIMKGNSAGSGGALSSKYSKIFFKNITVAENFAKFHGGGIALYSSTILLSRNINFTNNIVTLEEGKGGGIYVHDTSEDCKANLCPISWTNETKLNFLNNVAGIAPALYGGMLDRCSNLPGGSLGSALKNITVSNTNNYGTLFKTITSPAIRFCYCSDKVMKCKSQKLNKTVFPGQTFNVTVACIDQLEQPTYCTVKSEYNLTKIELGQGESSSTIDECENLTFHANSPNRGYVELKMWSDILCTDNIWNTLKIDVNIENCPLGFQLEEKKCQCDKRLQSSFTNIDCCVNNNSIILKDTGWFSYEGGLLRVHRSCPLNYCSKEKHYFSPLNPDIQCGNNHGGILCGRCVANYSVVLGSWKCMNCSNLLKFNFIWLTVVMALAGVVLVVFLLLVKMTVSSGTMNGLIFYANILSFSGLLDNQACIISPILHVFLSWINLDFGTEVCFYSGMDVYQKTWLQYMFPFYIWFLVGVIILFCHYSSTIMKLMGMRNIEVLATLFLLSYAKLLKTIVTALSFTDIMVASADNVSDPLIPQRVWVFDGNLNYLSGKHLLLFIAALCFLLFLFLPYTALLTLGHYLKSLPDIRGIKLFHGTFFTTILDAYHAPYNKKHRYWTGLGLLIRCGLFTLFATSSSIKTNIFWIIIAVVLLFSVRLCFGTQVYQNKSVDILEIFFLLNLMILMLVLLYREVSCEVLTASISLSFAMFGFIVIYHIQHEVRKRQFFIKLLKPKINFLSKRFQSSAVPKLVDSEKPQGPSTSYVELRETLLDQ